MKFKPDTVRLRKTDLLLRKTEAEDIHKGILKLPEQSIDAQSTMLFDVVKVGENVSEVVAGQRVLVPWGRVTPGFTMDDDKNYHLTDESEIMAVSEADEEIVVV